MARSRSNSKAICCLQKIKWYTLALCSVLLFSSDGTAAFMPGEASLDEKIGQLLMVGFRGTVLNDDHFIRRDLRRYHLGGVILFDEDVLTRQPLRNISSPSQLKSLIAALNQVATAPLLVAIDQEGGRVARLKPAHGFASTASHAELGRADDLRGTYAASAQIATTLAELGINVNFAPVVDLCVNPDNLVIARLGRCFSDRPDKVKLHALEFIQAHTDHGVTAVIKHFPGHGSSQRDSHLGFADVSTSWTEKELGPYSDLINAEAVASVMTAHVFNATLDTKHPATLSYPTINGILRTQLDFEGVVFSDDLQMGAISEHYGLEQTVRLALLAGVDVLLFGNNLDYDPAIVPKVVSIIRQLISSGVLSEDRIDESYRRIMRLKGFNNLIRSELDQQIKSPD